jgi:hypothetical protein
MIPSDCIGGGRDVIVRDPRNARDTKPAMQKDKDTTKPASSGKGARQDRLKLALRENLKRRKAQARGRDDVPASSTGAKASLDDGGNEASD